MKKKTLFILTSALLLAGCGTNTQSSEAISSSYEDNSSSELVSSSSLKESSSSEEDKEVSFSFSSDLEVSSLYPLSSGGVNYYFSEDGDDKNDGLSEKTPMKSLDKASTLSLKAGDQLLFKKGDTFVGHLNLEGLEGKTSNPITIASYGEGERKPILKNAGKADMKNVVTLFKPSNVVLRDLAVEVIGKDRLEEGSGCISGIEVSFSYMRDKKCKNIYIINNDVKGSGIDSNIMGINIASYENKVADSPHKILNNLYVCYNRVEEVGRSGIHSGGWLYGETVNGNEGHRDKYTNVHFDHNTVLNVGCMGIYPMCSTNGTCNYNYIDGTGMANSDRDHTMEGECGIMALCNENIDIQFNEILNCKDQGTGYDAMGIDIDWNTNNINVQYNYCHDNQGAGIGTMANQNCFIRNNRLVNNEGSTNNKGSICITNFTSRYDAVPTDWHSVKNCTVDSNLIYHYEQDYPVFNVRHSNGDKDFAGNSFTGNHAIYNGDTEDFYWITAGLSWSKFEKNKYYSFDTANFKAMDATKEDEIPSNSVWSEFYPDWATWSKRDVNSTYEEVFDDNSFAKLSNFNCDYDGMNLHFTFDKDDGSYWHANVYKVASLDEELSIFNMVGESDMYGTSFTYNPSVKEEAYYVFQVESELGNYGMETYPVKVTL